MSIAIQSLMHEHRIIEHVLASLSVCAEKLAASPGSARPTVAPFVEFFRTFADRCHHGKEEDRLFVAMTQFGLPRQVGPIAVMLADHAEGRRLVGELAAFAARPEPVSDDELEQLRENVETYVDLLGSHIQKEDSILYPMALKMIPAQQMEALAQSFEDFEREVIGDGEHERLHALAQELIEAWPSSQAQFAGQPMCVGCAAGH